MTTVDLNAQTALDALQNSRTANLASVRNSSRAKTAAEEFEGVFIGQMLSQMFSGIETDGTFGGGVGEDVFRSLMVGEYGKEIAAQGGVGLGDAVLKELIGLQEQRH